MALETFMADEATISIYPLDSNGDPDTDNPVWLGTRIKGLRIAEALEEVVDRPSGVDYGEAHHVDERHEIGIGKLWTLDLPLSAKPATLAPTAALGGIISATNGVQYRPKRNQNYVMVIAWEHETDQNRWYVRTYFGVTDRSKDLQGQSNEGTDEQFMFRAQYYLEGSD